MQTCMDKHMKTQKAIVVDTFGNWSILGLNTNMRGTIAVLAAIFMDAVQVLTKEAPEILHAAIQLVAMGGVIVDIVA